MTSALLFCVCSLQATWSTALPMTMCSTIDGPLNPPAGHTFLWRISNQTLGNPDASWCVFVSLCFHGYNAQREADVSSYTKLSCLLIHGIISHMGVIGKVNLNLQTQMCFVERSPILNQHVMFRTRMLPPVQVLGCGCVFISWSRPHIMHMSVCNLMRMHVSVGINLCLCGNMFPLVILNRTATAQRGVWVGYGYCNAWIRFSKTLTKWSKSVWLKRGR